MKHINLGIIDDHLVVIDGLKSMLEKQEPPTWSGSCCFLEQGPYSGRSRLRTSLTFSSMRAACSA